MAETQKRTVVKTIGYRVTTIIQGFVVAYGLTGSIIQSIKFTVWTNVIGVVMYYAWERFWNRVDWGTYDRSKGISKEDVRNEGPARLG